MNFYTFSAHNGFRHKVRTSLMILAIMVSIFLLTVLQIFLREFTQPVEQEQSSYRVITIAKTSLADVLPIRYRKQIESVEGVDAVTPLIWFGGTYIDERNFFPQFAVDPKTIFKILSEIKISEEQMAAFLAEKNACVVGKKTMERFGWKIGQKIVLQGTIWGFDAELIIRGTYSGGIDETNLFMKHDYFDDMLERPGFTGSFWIKVKSPEDVPKVSKAIDDKFRNTEAETKTETERAFVLGFASMLGDIKVIIGSISTVIMFTLLIVTAGTMAINIRERYKEIAMLKAIGFGRLQIVRLIVTEIVGITMIGAFLGCGIVYFLVHNIDLAKATNNMLIFFELTPTIIGRSLLVAFITGLISSLAPVFSALRISVVDGLRDIE